MPETMKDRIKESLAVGAALGLLTLALAFLFLFEDSRGAAFERAALQGPSTSIDSVGRVDDPDFDRVYGMRDSSGPCYGVVFSARSADASAIFGALFSPKGELRQIRLVGSCSARLPEDARAALDEIAGAEDILERAGRAARAAAEADS